MDADQTTETEKETEQQVQMEVQEQKEPQAVKLGLIKSKKLVKKEKVTAKKDDDVPYFKFETYAKDDPYLKSYADAFEGIHLTFNVLEWSEEEKRKDLQLLGNHRTPIHFVNVVNDDEVIILSQNEAKTRKNESYNLGFGYYDPNKPVSDKLLEKITKIEFLNGESSYSKKKQDILKKWFAEQGVEKMRELYNNQIIAGQPEKIAAYSSSNLKKIFEGKAAAAA